MFYHSTDLDKIFMLYSSHHINFTGKPILKLSSFFRSAPTIENFDSNNSITIPGKQLDNKLVMNTQCESKTVKHEIISELVTPTSYKQNNSESTSQDLYSHKHSVSNGFLLKDIPI